MAYRYGNNYRVLVVDEVTAGTTPAVAWGTATNWHLIPDIVEMSEEVAQIETNSKTGTGLATYCENRPGYQNATVTLTGVLSHEHEFLLKGLGYHYATGVYTLDALPATFPTFSIVRLWSDALTGNPANKYVADIAVGCQLSSLKITGGSGDMVRYEATFQSMGITAETTISIAQGATNDPGTPCVLGFNFGHVTAELWYGSGDCLKSFELTLGYEIADDATSFQNSNTRLETIPLKATPELSYVTNYDTDGVLDTQRQSSLYGETAIEEEISLVMVDGATTHTWTITTHGQLTSYTFADPGRALFENSVTERLCYYSNSTPAYPVTITVTSA
jgi:hypothetical protein